MENMLQLKEAQEDGNFMAYQKDLFQTQIGNILDLEAIAQNKPDIDTINMITELVEKEITNADWKVTIAPDLDDEKNYTLPII